MNRNISLRLAVLLIIALFSACGGGGGTSELPQKSAEVTFGTSSNDPSVQIKGISLVTTLPAGVTVATEPGSTQISTASLKGVGVQVFGRYSAAIRKVTIATLPGTIALGPYAKLTCSVVSGFTLQESAFTAITPLEFQPIGPGGIDLTTVVQPVRPTTSVTFGY
jgi:hypothetical protein